MVICCLQCNTQLETIEELSLHFVKKHAEMFERLSMALYNLELKYIKYSAECWNNLFGD